MEERMSAGDDRAAVSGPTRRAADLSKFREMINRQTDELNIAIQQRSDYERRLEVAERLVGSLQEENDTLKSQSRSSSLVPPQHTSTTRNDAVQLIPAFVALVMEESAARVLIMQENSNQMCGDIFQARVAVVSAGRVHSALQEERSRTSALTFQLRVATPMRIRGLLAKQVLSEKREAAAQKTVDELNKEIEMLLLESGDLREKNVELEGQLRSARKELDAVSSVHDQLEDSHGANEELLRQIESHTYEVETLHNQNEALRKDLEAAAHELHILVERESASAASASSTLKESAELGNTLRETHARDVQHLEEQLSTMRSTQRKLESDKKSLANREQGLAVELDALQSLVTRLKQDKENAIHSLGEEKARHEADVQRLHEAFEERSAGTVGELRALRMAVSSADVSTNTLRFQTEALRQQLEEALQRNTEVVNNFIAEKKLLDERCVALAKEHSQAMRDLQDQAALNGRARDRHWEEKFRVFSEEAESRVRVLVAGRQELLDSVCQNEIVVLKGVREHSDLVKEAEACHRRELAALEDQYQADLDQRAVTITENEQRNRALTEALDDMKRTLSRKDVVMDELHQQCMLCETQLREERAKRRELTAQCAEQEELMSSLEKMLSAAQIRASRAEDSVVSLEEKVHDLMQVTRDSGKVAEERHQKELQALIDSEMSLRRQRTQLQAEMLRSANEVERLCAVEETLRQHASSNQQVMEQQHAEIVQLRDEIDQLQQSRRALDREKLHLEAELADLTETRASYKDVLGNATTARATLTEELLHLQEKFAAQTVQLGSVEVALEHTKVALEKATSELQQACSDLDRWRSRCEQLELSCEDAQGRLRDCVSENATLKDIMEESVEAVETEVRALQVEAGALKHDNDRLRRDVESRDAEIQRLGGFVASLQTDSVTCESHWKDRYHAMENQCAALRSQVTTLEEQGALAAQEHTKDHKSWKMQMAELKDASDKELSEAHQASSALRLKVNGLAQTVVERNEHVEALEAQLTRLSNDMKLLECASVEALEEHRLKAEAAREDSLEYWGKVEGSAEYVARLVVQLDKVTVERDQLKIDVVRLTEEHDEMQRHVKDQIGAMASRHQNDALSMESMMESLVTQERQQRIAAAAEVSEVESRWRKAVQHGEVESMRADAAESSLQRAKEQVRNSLEDLKRERDAHDAVVSNLEVDIRALEHQLASLRASNRKLEDALELEKSSSIAEEHALREEIERREKQYEKRVADLAEEWRSELGRRGEAASHVASTHSTEVDSLHQTIEDLESKLRVARSQHTELFQRYSAAQQKVDEVSQMNGATRMECNRLMRSLEIKDENLEAALSQAADAANAAAAAADAQAESDRQAMELRRALMAAQRDLEVARKNELSTAASVGSLEATIEARWERKLRVQDEQWLHVARQSTEASASILVLLETAARDALVNLYDDVALTFLLTRLGRSWQATCDRWLATESRLIVDLDAITAKHTVLVRQTQATSATLQLLLCESDSRCQLLLSLDCMPLYGDFATGCSKMLSEYQRDLRAQQARSGIQEQNHKRMRTELEENRGALQAAKLELDEVKRNCDSFSKISEEMSVEASEWKSKYNAEAHNARRSSASCTSVLEFASRHIMDEESQWRYRFQTAALDIVGDVAHVFNELFADSCRENVALHRMKERTESVLRAEVDTLHAAWRDRLEDANQRSHDLDIRFQAQTVLSAEALGRAATHQAMHMWVAQQLLPSMHSHQLAIVYKAHQREVRELRHAIYVGHKESLLIKQRAQSLVEMEVSSSRQVLDRLHRRRVDDLRWLPHNALVPSSMLLQNSKEPTPGHLVALYLVEDLETQSRAIISRLSFDALHALHMCLLIS